MIGKLLAGGAAVLTLALAGQGLAQSAPAGGSATASAPVGNVGQGIEDTLAAGRVTTIPPASEDTTVAGASAGAGRKARRDGGHGNVVTSTLSGVPGLVGGTVGGALGNGASQIGGTVGGALGVGKPRPEETPSRP